jgi:hypothetical protein
VTDSRRLAGGTQETFEIELSLRAIFETPSIAGLALIVEGIILRELDAAEPEVLELVGEVVA